MIAQRFLWTVCLLLAGTEAALAQPPILPPGDKDPLLRLEAEGPTSYVTALAFSPDGKMLYAAGWDKVVRVWTLNARGRFEPDRVAYRVPLGPGLNGAINAIALSDDGTWLAVGGMGTFREGSGFRRHGWVVPSAGGLSPEMRMDRGLIYVFNTRTQAVRLLRGHAGPVLSLAFAPSRAGKPLLLLSGALEWDQKTDKATGALRLWDVARGESVDSVSNLPSQQVRPGLALWHTGDDRKQVGAAAAWFDGRFRLWDVDGRQGRVWEAKDGNENLTAAAMPGRTQVLTAGHGKGHARLKVWDVSPGRQPQVSTESPAPAGAFDAFPQALALFSTKPEAGTSHAAVVVGVPRGKEAEYRLQLLGFDRASLGTLQADEFLWKGTQKQPVLATAPQGDYLAVAGNEQHEILIYPVRDLLKRQAQPQRIHSAGRGIHYVSFVRKGKDLGLLVNEAAGKAPGTPPRAPAAGDLVFDFARRGLLADTRGWEPSVPAADGWRASQPDGKRPVIEVRQGERLAGRVTLKDGQVITDFALLPPRPPQQIPILALAYHERGQPWLGLYNATTGEPFRQYAGHVDRIYCLAFSDDGRLLVSAAEDQTICVWSLTNLGKILGNIGQLPGVAVKDNNGTLVVSQVAPESPARGKLTSGEVIEGLVESGKLKPLASPRDFHEAIAFVKPGKTITLRVRGGQAARDVPLEVGQGIDERKPLLSLFVTAGARPEEREWIGWNPIGPYDSSGQKAERLLGWHFNTGSAEAPTRFAFADQYRKQYYRQGILNDLVVQGDLQRIPPLPPPPPPKMTLLIDDHGSMPDPDGQGQLLVRHAQVTLSLIVTGRPLDSLEGMMWRLDGGPEQRLALEPDQGQRLAVPLTLPRGVHRLRVVARAPEGQKEYAEEVVLRYQPPPPQIQYAGSRRLIVQEPAFTLQALVHPGQAGEEVAVSLAHQHQDKNLVAETKKIAIDPARPLSLQKGFTLRPGSNLIEVVAINADAVRGFEAGETSRLALEVTLVEKARPPVVALDALLPEGEERPLPMEPGKVMRVSVPRVELLGKMEASGSENLVKAEWLKEGAPRPTALARFTAGKSKELAVREELRLQPGVQTFRFRARTATSDEAEVRVTLEYQPPVPTAALTAPATGLVLHGDGDAGEVQVKARLTLPADRQPYQARVLLNEKVLDETPAIDDASQTLTARVRLRPGTEGNRIQLRLNNQWGAVYTTGDAQVYYLRPPHVANLQGPAESERPFVDLVAQVRSAVALLPASVRLEGNGKQRPVTTEITADPAGGKEWTVHLKDLPLDPEAKTTEFRLWISNREGECLQPAHAAVVYKPRLPAPEIELLDPRESSVVHTSPLKLRVHVRSKSPLKHLTVIREGDKPVSLPVAGLRPDAQGTYELTTETELRLARGANNLRVEAVNDGGQQEAALVVTYPYRPVRLVLDRLVPREGTSEPLAARELPGSQYAFPEAQQGREFLEGRVLWDEEDDDRLKKTRTVRVYVNGFQQKPAELKPAAAGSRIRTFRAEIVLNQAGANQVSLALPELEEDACSCTRLLLSCQQPVRTQRLHVLAVSVVEKDRARLRKEFLDAVQCRADAGGQPKSTAFDEVYTAPALTGSHVRADYVRHQLLKIQERIKGLVNAGGAGTDVVMFYYQGSEAMGPLGHFFQTGCEEQGSGDAALSCDDLVEILSNTPGAHILLLDVGRDKAGADPAKQEQDKVAHWADSYGPLKLDFCVLRYAWLGRPDSPPDAGLLKTLQRVLPQAPRLVDVTNVLRQSTVQSASVLKNLAYDQWLAKDMEGLTLSRAP